jgi:heme/copper-type cytochrome/quinol oxidase subunit 4
MIISAVKSLIFPIAAVLIVQYVLALFALMKLFTNKPKKLNSFLWNFIIVLIIIIGPIIYLVTEKPKKTKPTEEKPAGDENRDYTI